jgi:hypothetical protein
MTPEDENRLRVATIEYLPAAWKRSVLWALIRQECQTWRAYTVANPPTRAIKRRLRHALEE